MPAAPRSTTTYALLGLLSVRPWTTYELAQQVRRSLNWFWPRAERRLYEEPKRLVADGLASSRVEYTGKRRRTVYQITDAGRAELHRWLDEPARPQVLESEAMVKLFFADAGDLDQLRRALDRVEQEALERLDRLGAMAAAPSPFPQRLHLSALLLRRQVEEEAATLGWVRWAREQVALWSSPRDPGAWDAQAALGELGARVAALAPDR